MHAYHLLRLLSVPRIGPLKVRALVQHFGSPDEVFRAHPRELVRVPGIDKKLASAIAHHRDGERFAEDQVKRANRLGVQLLTVWDTAYPPLLRKIYDPPPVIFVSGRFIEDDVRAVALVGTRQPSQYGIAVTRRLCSGLCERSITVISGLARGIDTVAHATALQAHGRTIAVIGSGLDVPYPSENRSLMEQIADSGAVVSEFPFGTKPDPQNFPRRNRIISGISRGTVVIESDIDGGAMITASTALDQNREVFAVPGQINDRRSAGPHLLIQQGRAKLVQSIDDILVELGDVGPTPRKNPAEALSLTLFEQRVYDMLDATPQHIDLIAEKTQSSPADALVMLLSLEFKGLVRQLPGKYFVRD